MALSAFLHRFLKYGPNPSSRVYLITSLNLIYHLKMSQSSKLCAIAFLNLLTGRVSPVILFIYFY